MWAIGNGESRRDIDIAALDGKIVGCNAIMRDYTVDYLVCVDRRMVNEALERGINETTYIYTRNDWHKNFADRKKLRIVPDLPYAGNERADDPFHWGSGPYAVLLAAKKAKNETVNLLGFDLYGIENKVNNIYKDTDCYDLSVKRAVDPRYWIHQIGKVFEHFPKTNFRVYVEDNWERPKAWKKSNVYLDRISNISYNN
jgi:hypothetical protein